mgnify:CR=1 FL=1
MTKNADETVPESDTPDYSEMKLEELFDKLDTVAKTLQGGEVSLEESFQLYYDGMKMLKACNDKIDRVERKMKILDEEGELHEF